MVILDSNFYCKECGSKMYRQATPKLGWPDMYRLPLVDMYTVLLKAQLV